MPATDDFPHPIHRQTRFRQMDAATKRHGHIQPIMNDQLSGTQKPSLQKPAPQAIHLPGGPAFPPQVDLVHPRPDLFDNGHNVVRQVAVPGDEMKSGSDFPSPPFLQKTGILVDTGNARNRHIPCAGITQVKFKGLGRKPLSAPYRCTPSGLLSRFSIILAVPRKGRQIASRIRPSGRGGAIFRKPPFIIWGGRTRPGSGLSTSNTRRETLPPGSGPTETPARDG